MTPTPPSSTGHSPQEHNQSNSNSYRVVRKRNRVPLSCAPCRNRKLKCNRSHPCENCIRRGDPSSCTYAMTPHNTRTRKQSAGSNTSSDEMQSRIDRLEGLVLSLMGSNGSPESSPRNRQRSDSAEGGLRNEQYHDDEEEEDMGMGSTHGDNKDHGSGGIEEEVEEVRSALGIMKVEQGKSFYRGETHWAAILSEISEVKNFFNEMKQTYEGKLADLQARNVCSRLERTGFPFSAGRPPTKEELLALVPRQDLVDLLVDTYFRNYDPIFHVLHRPTFYKQYEEFWRDPPQVDMIWLGLLMSIMCLSLRIYNRSGEEPPELVGKTIEMSHAFKAATEQCLIVGDYTKKLYIHTIQTLILLTTQQNQRDRAEDSWLLLGSLVRVALCMGLHRDPKNFPQISPSEGEIRKRLWTIICCMDILESIKIGLPSMIRLEECDTSLPLNLHDDEIGDNTSVLPPERGHDELTGVSYMIAKASLARIYAKIVAQASSLVPRPAYDQILKMDTELHELYSKAPSFLQLKTKEDSKDDPAWLIIQRYNLDLIVQKALVTLHRPYAARVHSNPRYQNSRRKCVDASMVLLKHQSELFLESQSTLRHARWFTESLGCHDFLHAAMIICLDLSTECKERKDAAAKKGIDMDCEAWKEERAEQFRVLESTKLIYETQKESSIDCVKAYGVLRVMLEKLRGSDPIGYFDMRTNIGPVGTTSVPATPGGQIMTTDSRPGSGLCQGTPSTASINTPSTQTFIATPSSTGSEIVDSPNDPLKSDQAAAMTLGMMSGGGMTPNSAAAGMMLDRAATPGGTNILMGDVGNGGYGSPGVSMPFSGNSTLWTPNTGVDMTANLDWDDWDSFMQGINMDTSQSSAWPVLPGLSTNMPMSNFGAPVYAGVSGGGTGSAGDGGGGGGQQQQQSPGSESASPNTIPGMAGLFQPLVVNEKPVR